MLFENSHPTHSVFFGAMSTVLRRAFPATHRTHPAGSMTTLFRRNFVTLRRTTFPDGYSTSMKSRVGFSLLLLFLTLATASIALAQNTGTLEGRVTDARTGEPLTGATVALKDTQLGAFADADGFYSIQRIPPGNYTVLVTFVGYEPQERVNISIRTAGNRDINFELLPSQTELEEVVVTVREPFQRPPENPLSYRSLSPEEISTYPAGNSDIAKVVQSLPGVSGSVTGFRNDVIIRGGAPNENVYYLDAIEIPSINHFSTQGSAGGPVGLLNVTFFDGVELSTSAFGAGYGNALSGVLQFNQRTGNDREFRTNFRVGASEAALTAEGPLFRGDDGTSNTTFIVSARRSYLQLLFQLIDLPFLPDYWDYQYKVNHDFDRRNRVYITGVGSIDDFSINVPEEADEEQQAILEQIPVIRQRTNTTGIAWRHRFASTTAPGQITTSLSTTNYYNEFLRYRDNVNQTGLFSSNQATERWHTLRTDARWFLDDLTVSTGGQVRWNLYRNDFRDENTGADFNTDLDFISYGLFAQASWEPRGTPWSLTGGVRADANSFTGNALWTTLSPRLSARARLDQDGRWLLNASVGRYYKMPTATLLGYQVAGSFVNRDLKYIRSDHFTVGLDHFVRASTKLSVEGFLKLYDDYPVSLQEGVSLANLGADFEVLGNEPVASLGRGRTYGVEFLFQQRFVENFFAIAAYTLFWSEFTGADRDVFRPSAWDSRHLLTLTGGYRFNQRWEISFRSRFVGTTPFAPVDEERSAQTYPAFVFDYNALGDERLSVFTATDVRVDRKWNFRNFSLDVFLEIQNVLGQDTPSTPSYLLNEGPPRELRVVEQVSGSSVLPTIGLILDF